MVTESLQIRKFVIVNRMVQEEVPDIYNGVFDTESKRTYIHKLPLTTVNTLLDELLKLSENVNAIQIEFDRFREGHNIEFEIYLKENVEIDFIPSYMDISITPCSIEVSERFYNDLIKKLVKSI